MSEPWLKFYPSDWRADPALRMCSLAARGLWIEMLCVMHEATPRGSLVINGAALNDRQIAALAGCTVPEAAKALASLEEAGVFSRDADGTIYSRRIRRDDAKAARDKANGRKGGNRTLLQVKQGVNPPDNGDDKGEDKGEDKAHIPEARSQIPEEEKPSVLESARKRAPKPQKQSFDQIAFEILTDCLTDDMAKAVIEHRRAKGAKLTEAAARGLVREFWKVHDPNDAAETMIVQGWQGFNLDWYRRAKPGAKIIDQTGAN